MKPDNHVALEKEWATAERWRGIKRGYTAADVEKLRGSVEIKHTLAERGAKRLWESAAQRAIRSRARGDDRLPGGATGAGRVKSYLSERLASRR